MSVWAATTEQLTSLTVCAFVCTCVFEHSLYDRPIHSVVTVILRDRIDWSWWRLRYQVEGHLSLPISAILTHSFCYVNRPTQTLSHTHTYTHWDSLNPLERPHQWIEIESNHIIKWLHNNLQSTSNSLPCPCKVYLVLMTERGIEWQLCSSLLQSSLSSFPGHGPLQTGFISCQKAFSGGVSSDSSASRVCLLHYSLLRRVKESNNKLW